VAWCGARKAHGGCGGGRVVAASGRHGAVRAACWCGLTVWAAWGRRRLLVDVRGMVVAGQAR
jgi:hypothetical protein